MKATIVVVLGVFIIGAVFNSSLVGCSKENETMGATNDGLVPNESIPAIDVFAPIITETATFALG
jgi:hypothetical protein